MPSGHASHKGTSDKPNTNAPGQIDSAADTVPADLLPEGPDALRASEAPENSAATQRPDSENEK
jgi:hypothetical protein